MSLQVSLSQEYAQTLYLLKLSATQSKTTITKSNGLRPNIHHGFRLLRVDPHVPLQTPGVDSCQLLIQRFNH